MTESVNKSNVNGREVLKHSGALAADAAVLGNISPVAFARDDNTIRLALIGCGGRGADTVGDALSIPNAGPMGLYAMADLYEDRMESCLKALKEGFPDTVDVRAGRKFIGFDTYKKAIDILQPGDIAMCTTRSYIRPLHVKYAIHKGINVFVEKPFASDPCPSFLEQVVPDEAAAEPSTATKEKAAKRRTKNKVKKQQVRLCTECVTIS